MNLHVVSGKISGEYFRGDHSQNQYTCGYEAIKYIIIAITLTLANKSFTFNHVATCIVVTNCSYQPQSSPRLLAWTKL